MSSILTNNSSMVALNTLRNINKQLGDVQSSISTGKKIGSAKDNAAIWSVSAVMNSDVTGFKAITDSLSLGQSTLNVARAGAETVNNLLEELKGRIISAQSDNVDRGKIQDDAAELRNNINATVAASQFNGLNMLQRDVTKGTVDILGSLDRSSSGAVVAANITVSRATLEQGTATAAGSAVTNGAVESVSGTELATTNLTGAIGAGTTYAVGDKIAISITAGTSTSTTDNGRGIILTYEVTASDTGADGSTAATAADMVLRASRAMAVQLEAYNKAENGTAETAGLATATLQTAITAALDAAGTALFGNLTFDVQTAGISVADIGNSRSTELSVNGAQTGGLAELGLIDVSTKGGAAAALSAIETMTQSSINAAAAFGSSGKRIDIQMDFLKNLTDSLTAGIGSLVDADMEETSARLQALQVQQQLGIQSLSIANQQPQTLLSLFR